MKLVSKSFPDLAESMKLLKISVELEGINRDSILSFCILEALKNKKPIRLICKEIKEAARDNRERVSTAIGEPLLLEIENIKL